MPTHQNQKTRSQKIMPIILFNIMVGFPLFLLAPNMAAAACTDDPAVNADWTDCRKRNLILSGKDFSGSRFANTDFTSTDMSGSTLDMADFTKANITRANLTTVSGRNTNFSKVVGNRTTMADAILVSANFEKAEIPRTDFTGAQLSNTSFSKAEIGRAGFSGARLADIDFSFSNLARADFRGAVLAGSQNLMGAYLFQARMDGLDMSTFTGISQWQIDMMCGDAETILPPGFERPSHWPCPEGED